MIFTLKLAISEIFHTERPGQAYQADTKWAWTKLWPSFTNESWVKRINGQKGMAASIFCRVGLLQINLWLKVRKNNDREERKMSLRWLEAVLPLGIIAGFLCVMGNAQYFIHKAAHGRVNPLFPRSKIWSFYLLGFIYHPFSSIFWHPIRFLGLMFAAEAHR